MSYAAHQEAHKHLSEAGREVLEMMDCASRNAGISIADGYVEASATATATATAAAALPPTGGASAVALSAAVLLVAGGLLARRIVR